MSGIGYMIIEPVVDCPVCGDDAEHASAPGPNEPTDEYDCPHCGHQFRRPPTVDDVLAALVADEVTSVHTTTWGAPGHEARTFVTVKRGGVKTEHSAPTLRAAILHAALATSLAGVADG